MDKDKAHTHEEKYKAQKAFFFFEAGRNLSLIFAECYSIHPVLFKPLLWAKLLLCGGDLNFRNSPGLPGGI